MCDSQLKSFNDAILLHRSIEKGDLEEVKKSLLSLSHDKYFFDSNRLSAPAYAIKLGKHEIYEFFVSQGIYLGPHELMDEITNNQKRNEKEILRDIHKKYLNTPSLKHLVDLNSSSRLSHEASPWDRRIYLQLIAEAFEDLNGLSCIEPILKVASTAENLKIVFDFNRDSVEFVAPGKSRKIMGTSYNDEGYIYIGAKDLIRNDEEPKQDQYINEEGTQQEQESNKRCDVLGVLIHELTHFVMKIIYCNQSKPYKQGDEDKLDEFNKVVTATLERINHKSEPIITSVFDYPDTKHHAELIVRVPHLTALYKDDENKYFEVADEFSKLFDFFETKTLIDIDKELPVLEAKKEIREINESCGTLAILRASNIEMTRNALEGLDLNLILSEKMLLISSNCHQLTMCAILQLLCDFDNFESSYIFADLKTITIAKIFDFVLKAFKAPTNRTLIIDCEGERQVDEITRIIQKLNEQQISKGVVFVTDKISDSLNNLSIKTVKHAWSHLTKSFQKTLLNEKILFQGIELRLAELFDDLSSIESIPFQNLIGNQKILIGKDFNLKSLKNFIERKFLTPNSMKINSEDYSIEHDFDEVLNFADDHRTVLISDEPGMGKSTSLKVLQSKLRSKFSSSWIIFMDLKEHFESYETYQPDFKSCEEISKYFCEKILKTENFEAEIFIHLFCNDRVVLLMDGLDEICPTYKHFIFGLMSDIRSLSKNQLWMSTRPHLVEDLKKILNPIIFTLKPFTEANRKEFFEKYYSGDPNLEHKLKEIEGFMEKLNPHGWQDRSVSNPLVMKMILENLDDNQNFKLSEANLFSIYDQFTKKLVRKCGQEKGPEANNDISNSFDNLRIVEFHLKIAFEIIFSNDDKLQFKRRLIDPLFQFVSTPPLDEIVRVGLMFADGFGNFIFIHRTFAEFFIAKYFYESIFAPRKHRVEEELKSILEILLDGVLSENDSSFNFIRILLDSALELVKIRKSFKKVNLSENVLQFIETKLKVEHFEHMIKSGCLNLVKAVALQLSSNSKLLFETDKMFDRNLVNYAVEHQPVNFLKRFFSFLRELDSSEFERMFFELDNQDRNVFFFAAENDSLEVFNFLIDQTGLFMTNEKFAGLFLQQNYLGQNILHSAVRWDRNPKHVIAVLKQKLNPAQQRFLLEKTDNYGQNLMQFASGNMKSGENLKSLLAFMRKALDPEALMRNLLFEDLGEEFKAFDFAIVNESDSIYKVVKNFYLENFKAQELRQILFQENNATEQETSSKNCTHRIRKVFPNHYFYKCAIHRFYSIFLELFKNEGKEIFKQFFLSVNEDGDTLLMLATMKFNKQDFDSLWSHIQNFDDDDQKEVLEFSNSRSECAFHYAAKNKTAAVFQKVCNLYQDCFAKPNLRDIIASCDKNWFFGIVTNNRSQNSETFSLLCSFLKELFKASQKIGKLKIFFTVSNEAGRTIFMETSKNKNHENFVNIFNLCKELFSLELTKEFLLQKDMTGNTAFTKSIAKDSASNFEIVKNAYEELFERRKMQEIALAEVDGRNILSLSILKSCSLNVFLNLCNYLIKLFENEELRLIDFFNSFNRDGETLLMQAARSTKNYFKILSGFIDNLFENKVVEDILLQRNFKGATAFHFVVGNKDKSISESVGNLYFRTLGIEVMKEMLGKSF